MQKLSVGTVLELTGECPVIPAVKDLQGLNALQGVDSRLAFILFGDICSIGQIVQQVKSMGKFAIVHADLITGLSASKEIAADFICSNTGADGIISTKPAVIRRAKELHMFTIQRFFLLDSLAFSNLQLQVEASAPDMIEVLPGGLSKVIRVICARVGNRVIAGGLMQDKEDVVAALGAGAAAVSTTRQSLWQLQ